MKIGILSDTHSFYDPAIEFYFSQCDEIWHAGDIGTIDVLDKLKAFKSLRAVYGNIDGQPIRLQTAEHLVFEIEGKTILMVHIAGKMGSYTPELKKLIEQYRPDILVCGHSHILKIAFDKKFNLLYINPGAAGKSGFHQVRTIIRFTLENSEISEMQIIELGSKISTDSF